MTNKTSETREDDSGRMEKGVHCTVYTVKDMHRFKFAK